MRLTEKDKQYGYCTNQNADAQGIVGSHINKLGQLEDIEEELGVSLVTLFKALKQRKVWLKTENILTKETTIIESDFQLEMDTDYDNHVVCWLWFEKHCYQVSADSYGKIWALTKEELE